MDQIDLKELRIISYIALVIVILMFVNSFLGDISFRLTYINAKVTETTSKILDAKNNYPVQKDIPEKEQEFCRKPLDKGSFSIYNI